MMVSKRILIYFILLISVILLMISLKNCCLSNPIQRDYKEINNEKILRVVTDFTPLTYYISDDTVIGFDYELAKLISKRSGWEVEIYPEVSLSKSLNGLEHNTYDIVARQLPITTENREKYSFTEPLLLNKQVLVQRKKEYNNGKTPIRNQLDLAKKTLYIVSNSPARLRINNLAHEIGDTIYIQEEHTYGSEQLIMMIATGEIDFAVCDESIAAAMSREYPQIDYQTDISFTQFQSWALRKDSPVLLDSMNLWLEEIKRSKDFSKLMDKYFR